MSNWLDEYIVKKGVRESGETLDAFSWCYKIYSFTLYYFI